MSADKLTGSGPSKAARVSAPSAPDLKDKPGEFGELFADALSRIASVHQVQVASLLQKQAELEEILLKKQNALEEAKLLPESTAERAELVDDVFLTQLKMELEAGHEQAKNEEMNGHDWELAEELDKELVANSSARLSVQSPMSSANFTAWKQRRSERLDDETQELGVHSALSMTKKRLATMYGNKETGEGGGANGALLRRIIIHPGFSSIVTFMIVVSCISIGVEVQWMTNHRGTLVRFTVVGIICSTFFFFELCARLAALRLEFFTDRDAMLWNYLDLCLVILSLADYALILGSSETNFSSQALATVKMLKILRIFRVFRVFRFFRQLSQLSLMIMESFRSLIWALFLLILIMYFFGVSITMRATEWLKMQADENDANWLSTLRTSEDAVIASMVKGFSSLHVTAYTLIQVVLGGVSWHEVADPLYDVDPLSFNLLMIYILFTTLAVLNIVTGVFVDTAFRSAEKQKTMAIQKELERKQEYAKEIEEFFKALDGDGSGDISVEELEAMISDEMLSAYFSVLGFDIEDAARFIKLLDTDDSGTISTLEFLEGCMRLRGPAQGVDVHVIMRECRIIKQMLVDLSKDQLPMRETITGHLIGRTSVSQPHRETIIGGLADATLAEYM